MVKIRDKFFYNSFRKHFKKIMHDKINKDYYLTSS